ncbi:hypothetical protein L1281_001257 [Neisseria sp. HSC-16F19]|nr:hypothetical protein [Neisseria sp. HSC-16F19]MCP2040668.1 hypothetical protein [Neisseria sp. HSC-16F19]
MDAELEQRRAQILEQHRRMLVLFNAWMDDKKKREVVTYRRENGDLIEHHPDGTEKVIEYAAK